MTETEATPEWVDANFSDNRMRHFVFLHVVLGEPFMDAFWMAWDCRDEPLTLDEMRHVQSRWKQAA